MSIYSHLKQITSCLWTNIHILAPPLSSAQSLQTKDGSSPHLSTESDIRGSAVDKKHCFRMMVWLCAYYDFYDKKVHQCHAW